MIKNVLNNSRSRRNGITKKWNGIKLKKNSTEKSGKQSQEIFCRENFIHHNTNILVVKCIFRKYFMKINIRKKLERF